jgi:hypothetical protein
MFQAKRNRDLVGKHVDGSTIIVPYNSKRMEKGLKIWQALVSLILLIITCGTMIVNLTNKVETQRVEIDFLKSGQRDQNIMMKEKGLTDNQRFDKIQDQLTQILLQLQLKQNRR